MNTEFPDQRVRIVRELARGHPVQVVLIALLTALSTTATLALPMLVGKLVSAIESRESLVRWALVLVVAGFGAAAAAALATYLLSRLGLRLIYRLRAHTMRHALRLPLPAVRREGVGNLASRLTIDAAQVKAVIDVGPIQLPMAGLILAGTVVLMAILDWVLLLITIASFVAGLGIITLVVIGLRRTYLAVQKSVGTLSHRFVAALNALPVIKAYRAEPQVSDQLAAQAEQVARLDLAAARMESLMVPVITLSQQIALISVVISGGARMLGGQLALADFVAFLLYLLQLTAPLIMAASGIRSLQVGVAARERFNELFAMPDEFAAPPEQAAAPAPRGGLAAGTSDPPAVRFENVEFSYDGQPVLRRASFSVPARGLTAIVGVSGAGKTTVLSLIERFIAPDAGRVEVLGRDLRAWPLAELRGQIAYVDQASTLLPDSVRSNLTLGQEHPVADASLLQALERVGLAEEVQRLPSGLDTVLDGGRDLSGGQRQRLALARALLAGTPLVLLDEPSSQLDSVNEQKLRAVVDELARDRAVVVVAHRISTVQHADHVIVMRDGRVVAEGEHGELLRSCAEYAELVQGQQLTAAVPGPA